MTQEIINIGAAPNDGEGDPLRTAFEKINNNFSQNYKTICILQIKRNLFSLNYEEILSQVFKKN